MSDSKLKQLRELVAEAYKDSSQSSDPWQRWCYKEHVLIVEEHAKELANLYGGDLVRCAAGALLHDIADSRLSRDDPKHKIQSEVMAEKLLLEAGFDSDSTESILREVIAPHSCKEIIPTAIDGKILATADAITHLTSNFYSYLAWYRIDGGDWVGFKKWARSKLERDFKNKIFFEEVREAMEVNYKVLREVFVIQRSFSED